MNITRRISLLVVLVASFSCCGTPEVVLKGSALQNELLKENQENFRAQLSFVRTLLEAKRDLLITNIELELQLIEERQISEVRRRISKEYARLAKEEYEERESLFSTTFATQIEALEKLQADAAGDPTDIAKALAASSATADLQEAAAVHNERSALRLLEWNLRRDADVSILIAEIRSDVDKARVEVTRLQSKVSAEIALTSEKLEALAKKPTRALDSDTATASAYLPDVLVDNQNAIDEYLRRESALTLIWKGFAEGAGISASMMNDIVLDGIGELEGEIANTAAGVENSIRDKVNDFISREVG